MDLSSQTREEEDEDINTDKRNLSKGSETKRENQHV